jgi:flavin reductase (DIM6/NTAB) family NADH-FMN oxidoreductase RutF
MVEPREILGLLPHGLYLIGARAESEDYIYTASWLTQASFEPCLIATAVRKTHDGHALIRATGAFTVNLIPAGDLDLARVGFGDPEDRLATVKWKPCPETGAPVITQALGYIGCRVVQWVEGGDHDVAVAEAVIAERFREGELLNIHDTPWSYS